jgi:predicted anti-sigma-YlaC factor YlaD
MECERVREEFVGRLTGNIDAERSQAVDDRLAGCSGCRAETERMRELADDPLTMLTATGATQMPRNTPDELGGFFLIQADPAEAFRIARECPHLRYGGTVQVRRIQPT